MVLIGLDEVSTVRLTPSFPLTSRTPLRIKVSLLTAEMETFDDGIPCMKARIVVLAPFGTDIVVEEALIISA